jgi:hypothetical protein
MLIVWHNGPMAGIRFPACAIVASLIWTAAVPARATEPLPDRIWYHSRAGIVFQPGKGAIALPPSDKLRAMMIAESCSAAGGPRGVYKYMGGKVWLVGLHRCGGSLGLRDVYPGMLTPPVADWINGVVVARLGKRLCTTGAGVPIPEVEVHFVVENGIVNALEEKAGDAQTCALKPPQ